MIQTITGRSDFIERLKGKNATFMLALSNTDTALIAGITQAGIPGQIYLTPTLDGEFVCTGAVHSLTQIPKTPTGIPTPALLSRAVHLLAPFNAIELLNLGLTIPPKVEGFCVHDFGLSPSGSIDQNAQIDARILFEKGRAFGENYTPKSDYLLLGESVPSGTTTALATALALGYEAHEKFSSSFAHAPSSIKHTVLNKALSHLKKSDTFFDTLGKVGDHMLIFTAGFLLGAHRKGYPIVLAGGTQMACVLLVLNAFLRYTNEPFDASSIALATTKWVHEDTNSDLKGLLEMLDFPINAYYANFDFALSSHPLLALYDKGEAKEGVGAGGCLVYGFLQGLEKASITQKVEAFLA
ncbi:nicotinate mononucleotide-dependent phosphoribosyltransferase CobT [Sulfurospirillum barnesii]|uniref:TIGR00303 family protein n=1 Tax=Sulfurospirillum barnesii (strain ATCC 700032 / DSM 10660 / SES-3) TaxID=760154 RepID=I3XZN5_SULBS|nr:TIGR00303 family protein [Sulfurospirillum barnesii]AFL69409.1 TIGR00303 family protein [Sulfurospirillum barnesii SES-3]